MRNYLTELNIYGVVLLSRSGETARYVLNSLLEHCNKIIVVLDNFDAETEKIVNHYSNKYSQISVIKSGLIGTTEEQEKANPRCVYSRFKNLQGQCRQIPLDELKRRYNEGEKIDILLWPDHDEIFTKSLHPLLEKFWNSNYKSINIKNVDIFGDFTTIHDNGMTSHSRIFRYSPDLMAYPHRWSCHLFPIKREERIGDNYSLIHLSLMNQKMIDFRIKYWDCHLEKMKKWPLWRVGKDIRECDPEEISAIYKRPADCTVEEYLRGGNKYVPLGEKNLDKALEELSNLLNEMKIRFILLFGTALRLYRDGCFGLDWDLDLGIFSEDLDKFNFKLAENKGFSEIKIKTDIPKWKREDGTLSTEFITRTISMKKFNVRCDIDIIYNSKCGQYKYIPKGRRREFMVSSAPKEWFNKMNKIKYNDNEYNIPSSIEKYLESQYGEDWMNPQWGHRDWKERKACKYYYEI